jgi:hypothetical protein
MAQTKRKKKVFHAFVEPQSCSIIASTRNDSNTTTAVEDPKLSARKISLLISAIT